MLRSVAESIDGPPDEQLSEINKNLDVLRELPVPHRKKAWMISIGVNLSDKGGDLSVRDRRGVTGVGP